MLFSTAINDYLEALGSALVDKYRVACAETLPLKELLDLGSGFAFKSGTYVDKGRFKVLTIKNVQDGNVVARTRIALILSLRA